MSTPQERISLRELETVEEGLLPQRQKWQRWHQHPCSAEWKAMEIREGGGSADERELMNSRRIIELLETKEEVQKAQIATLALSVEEQRHLIRTHPMGATFSMRR